MRKNKPSATALLILKSIVFASQDPQLKPFVPQDLVDISKALICSQTLNGVMFWKACGGPWYRIGIKILERFFLPGIILHYILRKRYIEEVTHSLLSEGVTQVVILGAGFDPLAFRLSQLYPQVDFFELDHPQTQELKKESFSAVGLGFSHKVTFIPIDLIDQSLAESLLDCPTFNSQAKCLFILEGLTMYLKEENVNNLFHSMGKVSSPLSFFVFTFMDRQKNGSLQFKSASPLVDLWLRIKNETFQWGLSQDELARFLPSQQLRLIHLITDETLRELYLSQYPQETLLAKGEYICLSQRVP